MPELPDIVVLTRGMNEALIGRVIADVMVIQPKCLNLPEDAFHQRIVGRKIVSARQRGKWALVGLDDDGTVALNLGMGGEVVLHQPSETPDPKRERLVFTFADGWGLWLHFWWFGSAHLLGPGEASDHRQIGRLGVEPLDDEFTVKRLADILGGKRGPIKKYLLDQKVIAGIGNVYVQDTLFRARLHPTRIAGRLTAEEVERLHGAIRETLEEGIRWKGGFGEKDVWGVEGKYGEHLLVGYREGKPCPVCGETIQKLNVGASASYICPTCQPPPTTAAVSVSALLGE